MTDEANDIYTMLLHRRRAYAEFSAVTASLQAALEAGDTEAAYELVACREAIIEIIDGLDRRLPAGFQGADHPGHQPVEAIMTQLLTDLRNIEIADRHCKATATAVCDDLRNGIRRLRHREEGRRGYARPAINAPKFLDIDT